MSLTGKKIIYEGKVVANVFIQHLVANGELPISAEMRALNKRYVWNFLSKDGTPIDVAEFSVKVGDPIEIGEQPKQDEDQPPKGDWKNGEQL